jgi:hypothetical protein
LNLTGTINPQQPGQKSIGRRRQNRSKTGVQVQNRSTESGSLCQPVSLAFRRIEPAVQRCATFRKSSFSVSSRACPRRVTRCSRLVPLGSTYCCSTPIGDVGFSSSTPLCVFSSRVALLRPAFIGDRQIGSPRTTPSTASSCCEGSSRRSARPGADTPHTATAGVCLCDRRVRARSEDT